MTCADLERRWIISRIMCEGVLRAEAFEQAFGKRLDDAYGQELRQLANLEADGLVEMAAGGSLRLTFSGRLLVRNVAAVFDAYLPAQLEPDRPMFSSSV
jgi:oxygen-independent coproporphyrinogen-3 oxidase